MAQLAMLEIEEASLFVGEGEGIKCQVIAQKRSPVPTSGSRS